MLGKVSGFAMNRIEILGRTQPYIRGEFIARRVTGNMDKLILLGDYLNAAVDQSILQSSYPRLVPGDYLRGKNDHVAFIQCHMPVRAKGNLG